MVSCQNSLKEYKITYKQILKELRRLYRILDAGEKGYDVSAVNVNNRGLKVLFKSFAQQRNRFKTEIQRELQSLGGKTKIQGGLPPAIHRGRINIFAALTISKDEREKVVLKEILIGEQFALNAFKRALKKDIRPNAAKLISRQLDDIQQVIDKVTLMRGKKGKRLIIRLFDTEKDAENAVQEMKNAGLYPELVEHWDLNDAIELYDGKNTTVSETTVSGVAGGGFWGGLIGILAGVGMQAAGFAPFWTSAGQSVWAYLTLAGILAGGFVGSILGFAIGVGLSGEDAYQYDLSLKHGKVLLMTMVDALRAPEAGHIIAMTNLRSRDRIEEATA